MEEKGSYRLKYDFRFDSDLNRLERFWQREAMLAIKTKLSVEPTRFGAPLRQTLKGFRKLRVGDYRVIYRVQKKTVELLIVGHRSVVYREVEKRLGLR